MPSVTTWTRLEPRARSGDMKPGLEARVHDPLWLLGRQWQVGEFQGEDAGSPLWVRVRGEAAPLTTVRAPGGNGIVYDPTIPLETVVEREPAGPVDARTAADAGLQFQRFLADEGMSAYRQPYADAFQLAPAAADADADGRRYLGVMAGRVPDGRALASALRTGLPANPPVSDADRAHVQTAATRFLRWYDALFDVAPAGGASWQRERFEYRFEVAANSEGASVVLSAPEHQGGPLDWHSFVHDTGAQLAATAAPQRVTATTLPARATYAGMPAARFWELEDARVDFGGVDAAPTDLARMLVLDFATIYGNDWYIVPVELPVGTVTHIRSVVVGDTFGGKWLVASASEPGWTMYEPTAVGPGAAALGGRLGRLFLAPSLPSSMEGPPVEEVMLLRDEGANVAWAVERTVEGVAGTPVDRVEAWHERRRWQGDAVTHAGAPVQIAPLAYQLQSDVPEHWIPLVPEDSAPGKTVLRVSAIQAPGPQGGPPMPVLPKGRLLDPGTVFLVPEEEVPAEGARVTRSWQYGRWSDGSVHLWSSRRKRAGRGMGASGLGFDLVKPWQPPTATFAYETLDVRVTAGMVGGPVDLDHLLPGGTAVVRWRVRNAGTETWRRVGPGALLVGTDEARGHPGRLAMPSWIDSAHPCGPSESTVGPGQTATFLFEIRPNPGATTFQEAFDLVAGDRWAGGSGLVLSGRVSANTVPPSITGDARQGQTLTAHPGEWQGTPPFTFAYQWQRGTATGDAPIDIPGATAPTYVVTSADLGATLRVVVRVAAQAGWPPAASSPTAVVTAPVAPPTVLTSPAVLGTTQTGQTLTATPGSWSGSAPIAYVYQWRRVPSGGGSGVDIAGATAPTYVVATADLGQTLQVAVTASNTEGFTTAVSAPTAVVTPAPTPPSSLTTPAITGTPQRGQTLTASPGSWAGTPPLSYAYRWRRCDASGGGGVDIAGANAATYVVDPADVGFTLRVVVVVANSVGSSSATSAPTAVVSAPTTTPPANTALPTLSGRAAEGSTLTAGPGTWSGTAPITLRYQWQRRASGGTLVFSDIAGATNTTYVVAKGDAGYSLRVSVTASNGAGSATAASAAVVATGPDSPPANTAPPSISGEAVVGQTLLADAGRWSGSPAPTFRYQWQRCDSAGGKCVDIAGATGASYSPQGSSGVVAAARGVMPLPSDTDVGSTLRVVVTATNPAGTATAVSAPTAAVVDSGGRPPADQA